LEQARRPSGKRLSVTHGEPIGESVARVVSWSLIGDHGEEILMRIRHIWIASVAQIAMEQPPTATQPPPQ
jgi:hypothetical protein